MSDSKIYSTVFYQQVSINPLGSYAVLFSQSETISSKGGIPFQIVGMHANVRLSSTPDGQYYFYDGFLWRLYLNTSSDINDLQMTGGIATTRYGNVYYDPNGQHRPELLGYNSSYLSVFSVPYSLFLNTPVLTTTNAVLELLLTIHYRY